MNFQINLEFCSLTFLMHVILKYDKLFYENTYSLFWYFSRYTFEFNFKKIYCIIRNTKNVQPKTIDIIFVHSYFGISFLLMPYQVIKAAKQRKIFFQMIINTHSPFKNVDECMKDICGVWNELGIFVQKKIWICINRSKLTITLYIARIWFIMSLHI